VAAPSYEPKRSATAQDTPIQVEIKTLKQPASNLPPQQRSPFPWKPEVNTDDAPVESVEPLKPAQPVMDPVHQSSERTEPDFTEEQEAITQKEYRSEILLEAEIVGQVFDTYIILQQGHNMYLIDQHAAHERIRYETLKKRIAEGQAFSQMVLEPYVVRLSPAEYDFLFSRMADFERAGFEIEAFGPQTIIIRSVPDILGDGFGLDDFHEILDRWMETVGERTGISDEAIYMMACKSAIKANRRMEKDEIRALVHQLLSMENPYTCVHGRPVIISISQRELEKRFKRIV
jgi:DNA mismatch repair protein MutL